jgi:hypothetical protein
MNAMGGWVRGCGSTPVGRNFPCRAIFIVVRFCCPFKLLKWQLLAKIQQSISILLLNLGQCVSESRTPASSVSFLLLIVNLV